MRNSKRHAACVTLGLVMALGALAPATLVQAEEGATDVASSPAKLQDQTTGPELPASIADSIPDDAMLVSKDYALLTDGALVSVADGSAVTDEALVGTADTPPDPLAKTNGSSFVPMTVAEARAEIAASDGAALQALPDGGYGAYWGSSDGAPAFFMANGTPFAHQTKGVVDVSEHNGTIDWAAAKASGVEGAIIRIGFGTTRADYQAQRNINECKRLGIPFGVYLYSYSENARVAGEEGDYVVALLRQMGVSPSDLGYPVYYDLEEWSWTGHRPPTSPSTYEGIVDAWFSKVQGAGYQSANVYSYTSYLNGPLNSASIHKRTNWVAQYAGKLQFSAFGSDYRGWQYSSSGRVNGISGDVDLNAFGTASRGSNPGNGSGAHVKNGWNADKSRWYDNGTMARSHCFYDPGTNAWYWADADGSIAAGKDVFIPKDESDRSKGGKWVRFRSDRTMVKGEDCHNGGWYWFDQITGEMAHGITTIPAGKGTKTVYYHPVTGKMQYGEQSVTYDKDLYGWYYFDPFTGAMFHGDAYVRSNGGKWVRYDRKTGKMVYGLQQQDGAWYYFDKVTGAMAHGMSYVPDWKTWKYFDKVTGRWYDGMPMKHWKDASGGAYPSLKGRKALNVTVSTKDQLTLVRDGETVLYAMISSTGLDDSTPKGAFRVTGRGASFYNRTEKMGARYYVQFKGDYLFHTVPTDAKGDYIASEAERLGKPASHGCVRLTVSDAKWLYDNLPDGTPITIS